MPPIKKPHTMFTIVIKGNLFDNVALAKKFDGWSEVTYQKYSDIVLSYPSKKECIKDIRFAYKMLKWTNEVSRSKNFESITYSGATATICKQ
jgi:hypothetical protein